MDEPDGRAPVPVDDVGRGHGLRGGPLALALMSLVIAIAGALGVVAVLMRRWDLPMGGGPASRIEVEAREPRLETTPRQAMAEFRKQKQAQLERYGWADRERRFAQVPIEVAMRLVADGRAPLARACAPVAPRRIGAVGLVGGALADEPPPGFTAHPGAALPLDAVFTDVAGRNVALRDYFGRAPVILVLGYHHCRRLCSVVMDSLVQSLSAIDVPYRVLGVSIDPREDRTLAARKQAAYARVARVPADAPTLLLGSQRQTRRLAGAIGFHYRYEAAIDGYAHPAGFVVATPEGRVSRYFTGLRFDARELRAALVDAARSGVGSSDVDLRGLVCGIYDAAGGRHSRAVMTAVRVVTSTILLAMGVWIWRRRRCREELP